MMMRLLTRIVVTGEMGADGAVQGEAAEFHGFSSEETSRYPVRFRPVASAKETAEIQALLSGR